MYCLESGPWGVPGLSGEVLQRGLHLALGGAYAAPRAAFRCPMQKRGLAVKEFELIRKNFSDTGNFGKLWQGLVPEQLRTPCVGPPGKIGIPHPLHAGFGIQEHIDLGLKYDPSTGIYGKSDATGRGAGRGGAARGRAGSMVRPQAKPARAAFLLDALAGHQAAAAFVQRRTIYPALAVPLHSSSSGSGRQPGGGRLGLARRPRSARRMPAWTCRSSAGRRASSMEVPGSRDSPAQQRRALNATLVAAERKRTDAQWSHWLQSHAALLGRRHCLSLVLGLGGEGLRALLQGSGGDSGHVAHGRRAELSHGDAAAAGSQTSQLGVAAVQTAAAPGSRG